MTGPAADAHFYSWQLAAIAPTLPRAARLIMRLTHQAGHWGGQPR